eukprot:6661100-Prorocentrum_lima.AAC.1
MATRKNAGKNWLHHKYRLLKYNNERWVWRRGAVGLAAGDLSGSMEAIRALPQVIQCWAGIQEAVEEIIR